MTLYRYIPVWRRSSSGVSLYRCFEVLGEGFTVQSRDFYESKDVKDGSLCSQHDAHFLELLIEEAPEIRCFVAPTLEAAIEKFDAEFRE